MRVFITGASGFIGTALIKELHSAGHKVLGLARSDAAAAQVAGLGAEVLRGSLADLDILKQGATKCDGVIHLAFNHDFSKFADNCVEDRRAIEALGDALVGSNRPLIATGGLGFLAQGRSSTEDDDQKPNEHFPRMSEPATLAYNKKGVRARVMRLPQVHDREKAGLITYFVQIAKEKGVSAYVGDGQNRYPAAHVDDTAKLYRLALEYNGSMTKFHAVAEEGITMKAIAEVVGQQLNLPVVSKSVEEAPAHFGWMAAFAGMDAPASSVLTQKELNWKPVGPTLMEDLAYLERAKVAM
ncbi:MAG TPA: SDR family oxidoreductase [Drouetiella sp.]